MNSGPVALAEESPRTNDVATDRACTLLPPQNLHGKEGVDGSSPSEGFAQPGRFGGVRAGGTGFRLGLDGCLEELPVSRVAAAERGDEHAEPVAHVGMSRRVVRDDE